MAARSKGWVCDRSLSGIAGSNPAGNIMSVSCVLFCQVEVSAIGRSFVQGNSTECDLSVILKPHEGGGLERLRL
jgi:hypothetical protein